MFEYKTRTETEEGCRFYQQDILLFDYTYTGDLDIHCVVDYNTPGFGIVIAEYSDDISQSENVYIVKLGARNEYGVIKSELFTQKTLREGFIQSGKDINVPSKNLNLSFKFTENYLINIYSDNVLLVSYPMEHDISKYKVGFYSSVGNVIKTALIYSTTPTNWTHNIWNGNGGRINWIDNGFEIEECEYPCDVECQNMHLAAGKYYIDFETTNPDIEFYAFLTSKKVKLGYENYRGAMRYMSEDTPILVTTTHKDADGKEYLVTENKMFSEIYNPEFDDISNNRWIKESRWIEDINIAQKDSEGNYYIELAEDSDIDLRFRGTHGKITNISVKLNKDDKYVETGFEEEGERASSYILCDLAIVKKLDIDFTITTVIEDTHFLAENGEIVYKMEDLALDPGIPYTITINADERIFEINHDKKYQLSKDEDILKLFYNVDGIITRMIVTNADGVETDVLHQKTFKTLLSKEINSPILCIDNNNMPLDLSACFREVCSESSCVEIFNKYNPIKLSKPLIFNKNIKVAGANTSSINTHASSIDEAAEKYTVLAKNEYEIDYENNTVKIPFKTKDQYKYIIIEYDHCDTYRYEFTNYERQLADLAIKGNIYLENKICDVVNAITIYGVPKDAIFREELFYRVPNKASLNSIDYCVNVYDELAGNEYEVLPTGRLVLESDIRSKYKYLIIEYLKDRSYCVNERDSEYEIDIAGTEEGIRLCYDADEYDVTNSYSGISFNIDDAIENNFIILRKDVKLP